MGQALYEVIITSVYFNQVCENIFNYYSGDIPDAAGNERAASLADGLGFFPVPDSDPPAYPTDTLFHDIRAITNDSTTFQGFIVRNIYEDADFIDSPFEVTALGQAAVTGNAMSPAFAIGFKSSRTLQSIRRGHKRFVGNSEDMVTTGGVLVDTFKNGACQDLADRLGAAALENVGGTDVSWVPVICSKEKYETPSGKNAYKYYSTLSEQVSHMARGVVWQVEPTQRTQNSRQYGKGQ